MKKHVCRNERISFGLPIENWKVNTYLVCLNIFSYRFFHQRMFCSQGLYFLQHFYCKINICSALESKSCKGFFKINFPPIRALEILSGHEIYNLAYTYKFQLKTNLAIKLMFNDVLQIYKTPLGMCQWK